MGGGRGKLLKGQVSLALIVQFLSELPVPYFPKLKTIPLWGVQMRKESTYFSIIETHTPPHRSYSLSVSGSSPTNPISAAPLALVSQSVKGGR